MSHGEGNLWFLWSTWSGWGCTYWPQTSICGNMLYMEELNGVDGKIRMINGGLNGKNIYIPSGKLTCWSWKSAIFRWKLVFQPGLMAGSMLFWMVHGRWGYHHDWWAQMGMQSMYRSKNLQYLHWWKSTGRWFGTMEFYDLPYIGNKHPNWLSYFSKGLKPPTSLCW